MSVLNEPNSSPDPNDEWWNSLPPLVRAAAEGDVTQVLRLLNAGHDPGEADEAGWSALHAAAVRDHVAVVEVLLDRGAAVDVVDGFGFTPLLNAAGLASGRTLTALISAGARVEPEDPPYDWTPLSRAAEYGNAGALRALLEAGANVEGRPGTSSPLMDAAEAGSMECVDLLLEAGGDPTRKLDGKDAAALAREHGHHEIAARLDAAGRDFGC